MAKCKKGTIWDSETKKCRVPNFIEKKRMREWEKAKAKSHHYHCALFLDGDVVNKSFVILQAIKSKWFKHGNVPVNKLDNPHYNIRIENYKEERDAVLWRLSYYAKIRGKGYRNPQSSDYQTSRLK